MGLAGGFVIVIFFSVWSRAFGRAQALARSRALLNPDGRRISHRSVAAGRMRDAYGSYTAMFYLLALLVVILGLSAWFVTFHLVHKHKPACRDEEILD